MNDRSSPAFHIAVRDYRSISVLLKEWSDLGEAIGLKTVPNYSEERDASAEEKKE